MNCNIWVYEWKTCAKQNQKPHYAICWLYRLRPQDKGRRVWWARYKMERFIRIYFALGDLFSMKGFFVCNPFCAGKCGWCCLRQHIGWLLECLQFNKWYCSTCHVDVIIEIQQVLVKVIIKKIWCIKKKRAFIIFWFKLDLYILEPYITQKTDFT